MVKLIVFLFFGCFGISVAQEPTPLPEATRVFTCDQDRGYYPTDIVFAPDGTLYFTDAQIPLRDRNYAADNSSPLSNSPYKWFLYKHTEKGCTELKSSQSSTSGLALINEELCFFQVLHLKCLNGQETDLALSTPQLTAFSMLRDLVVTEDGFWLLADFVSPATGFSGAALMFLNRVVTGHVSFRNSAHFGNTDKGTLYATSYARDNIGILGGWLTTKVGNVETRVQLDFDMPSGILVVNEHLYIADYHGGTLNLVSLAGETLTSFLGLEGPMDLALSPQGEVCIAEMLGGRVSCYDLDELVLE